MRPVLFSFAAVIAVLMAAVSFLGCDGPGNAPEGGPQTAASVPSAKPTKIIGASLLTQSHVFYKDLVSALSEEAQRQGFKLVVQYCEFDGARQNEQMGTYVLQGVDAIIVSPQDSSAIAPAIQEAQAKKIPVFTVDIAAHGVDVVCHIASDNVQGGRLIGERLAKLLGGKGRVAIIDQPETASVQERVRGFEEALAQYPDMRIVQKVQGGGVRDKAFTAAQDLLQAHQDLNGLFGINDDSALGALAAVSAAGVEDRIIIVGYDGTPEACKAILSGGPLKADTVQYPKEIGKKAIEIVAAHFRGETIPKVAPIPCGLVDAEILQSEQKS